MPSESSTEPSPQPPGANHIVLVGPMGGGKSILGGLLAEALKRDFLDSDAWLEEQFGETGRVLAESHGLGHLHALELQGLQAMVLHRRPVVIAAAESVVDSEPGQRILQEHRTIWIDASPETLADRRTGSDHRRAMSDLEFAELRTSRENALAACSHSRVDTTDASPEESLASLLRALEAPEVGD